jgi:YfiH family protein
MIALPTPITAPGLAALTGIRHGFFTRDGGVSKGIYASLNCGLGSNDRRADVIENRRRVTEALGAKHVMTLYQAHTPTALVLDEPVDIAELPKADALVTRTPGLAIGVLAADCTPVLFADPEAKVVGAAHAGWRGALAGVLEATIGAMQAEGAKRQRIVAAIGPCISRAAYEVGPEFEADFLEKDAASKRFFTIPEGGKRAHFDLAGFVQARLEKAGIGRIERAGPCTFGTESLFSYRRSQARSEPDYGRQISAIVVA